jgi:hypothetical protein
MAVLQMNCLDEFDVELLRFGELMFIRSIEMNSSSKASVEMTDSVGDAGVGV